MAHDVSLTYTRFDHMSPTAVALTTLLHVSVALALWWISPLHNVDQTPDPIEITMEQEVRPPPTPQTPPPEPPPAEAAAPPPPPPPTPPTPPARLGLRPPIGTTMDSRAPLTAPPPNPTKPENPAEQPQRQEAAKPEPAKPEAVKPEPEKSEPEKTEAAKSEPPKEPDQQQQAALAPQPPPPPQPSLEKALPPVEAPPPPVTSREVPRPAAPPPPPPPPKPAPQPQPAPRAQAPQQQLPSSPLSHLPPQRTPAESQQAARPAPSPLTNPASIYGQRKAQEDYLWGVVRKISQHRYYPKSSRENSEEGLVVARITVARDGRLLDVAVARSSGYPTLDNALIEVIRQAAPYPPLPNDMPGDRHTFLLPLNYRRNDQ